METTAPVFCGESNIDVLGLHTAVLGCPTFPELAKMGCGYPHPASAAIAAAVAYDAELRSLGARDHIPRSTAAPTFIELVEQAAALRKELAPKVKPGDPSAAADCQQQQRDERVHGPCVE